MTNGQARLISTNQFEIHEDLPKIIARHQSHVFAKPIAEHTKNAFNFMLSYLSECDSDVILDACCGVGESTIKIAEQNPTSKVIGIDKSIARLNKHNSYKKADEPSNYILIQADLIDFWRLLASYLSREPKVKWRITKQYILYPNPYPKKAQIGKRWYASAIFKDILSVCEHIEWRSNWELYLQECLEAAKLYALSGEISVIENTKNPEDIVSASYTPFERKYQSSGQTCFKLVIHPEGLDK